MSRTITKVAIRYEHDVVLARQRARQPSRHAIAQYPRNGRARFPVTSLLIYDAGRRVALQSPILKRAAQRGFAAHFLSPLILQ